MRVPSESGFVVSKSSSFDNIVVVEVSGMEEVRYLKVF